MNLKMSGFQIGDHNLQAQNEPQVRIPHWELGPQNIKTSPSGPQTLLLNFHTFVCILVYEACKHS